MSRCPKCGRQLDEDGLCWVPGHSDLEAVATMTLRPVIVSRSLAPGDRHDLCGQEVDSTGCCACTDWGTGMMPTPTPVRPAYLSGSPVSAADFPVQVSDQLVPSEVLKSRSKWRKVTSADFPEFSES